MKRAIAVITLVAAAGSSARAAEICGNGVDDDVPQNGQTDEGCYPSLRAGVCESPLDCMDTGWVSWSTGSLHYDVPADVAPKSPFGPSIGLRRFYTSMYAPPATPSGVNRTPLGARWQHNYMSWIDQPADPTKRVLHDPRGVDVHAVAAANDGTWQYYQLQVGHHVQWFRQRIAGAREYELHLLSGDTLIYDSLGQLTEVWDRVAAPWTNKVRVAWTTTTGGRAVSTVTDATGLRRLRFAYTGAVLTSVDFQLYTNAWTTQHTTFYGYASNLLASVTMNTQLAQTNTYSAGYLVQIRDGHNRPVATFQYTAAKMGETVSIDTADGTLGFEYSSTRATCTGNTVLYFNKASDTACSADDQCGAGNLCGGKRTSTGATGMCFRAARCLTVDTTGGESRVTSVTPLGAPGECTGACATVMQYLWSPALDLQATQSTASSYVSTRYNDDGLPTKIVVGDPDADPTNTNGARTTWLFYDPVERGRLIEIRRQTALPGVHGVCSDVAGSWPCARTKFEYDPVTGEVARTTVSGFTTTDGIPVAFEYATTNVYNWRGQLAQIDGPLPGTDDVIDFVYFSSADPLTNGFLRQRIERPDTDPAHALTRTVAQYDFWGNATDWVEPDGTRSCRSYDAARNVIVKTSEEMNPANSSCATDDPTDLIESYTWDSSLRLLQTKRPDGSCMVYGYDSKGRLSRTMRRDDCNAASPGPREDYERTADGLVTAIYTYDAGGTITRKQLASYYDSRQLQAMINPVDTTKLAALTYDARGVLTEIAEPSNLGRLSLTVDNAYQLTRIDRTRSGSIVDPWSLTYNAQGQRTKVTDPDGAKIETIYDDAGRIVIKKLPGIPSVRVRYNEDGEVISMAVDSSVEYTRDSLGRPLVAHLGSICPSPRDITIGAAYDTAPLPCPIPGGCNHTTGRLAYVRVPLMCNSAFADDTLDQRTFYSYDAAGRVVAEHTTIDTPDGTGYATLQTYTWTKNGDLASATMPSTATIGFTYGSATSNADADLVTAVWRMSPATPVIDNVVWKPYGPVEQYNRQDTVGGSPLRMKMTYNQAYRATGLRLDAQNGTGPYYQLVLTEDAKGRVIGRDFDPTGAGVAGVLDSFFLYDDADRLLCESTVSVTSCPGSGSTLKNHLVGGLTGAGDRATLLRQNPGAGTGNTNAFVTEGGTHRITAVTQSGGTEPAMTTNYEYITSARTGDDNRSFANPNDRRTYVYDWRNNLVGVTGSFKVGATWHGYHVASAFDGRNRRVFKAFEDTTTHQQKQWYFYYDAIDRLTEVRYLPNATDTATSTTYQLFWLDHTLVAYWQTDAPTGATTKRYVESDETGRPVRMHAWPASGDSAVAWAINPDAWGMDTVVIGPDVYQPIVFAGQYRDPETAAYLENGTVYRPGLVLNGFRTYDPFTGGYLQIDPMITSTWSTYGYADGNPVGRMDPHGLATTKTVCEDLPPLPDPDVWTFHVQGRCWEVPTGEWVGSALFDPRTFDRGDGTRGTDRVGKQSKESRDKPNTGTPPRPPKDLRGCDQYHKFSEALKDYDSAAATHRTSARGALATIGAWAWGCFTGILTTGSPLISLSSCFVTGILAAVPAQDADEARDARTAAAGALATATINQARCLAGLPASDRF